MKEYSVIGKRLPRVDGVVKATGEAKFGVDIVLPRMVYGKVLRSPYPHAKILSIDTNRAERLPGVKAVIIGEDLIAMGYRPERVTGFEPGLAIDKVRYRGEGVAAVAAIDEYIAEEALELIRVEYEELPAVFDLEEAMREGAPRIHDNRENNIIHKINWDFGDVEKGFRESDHVREDRFTTQESHACYTEPLACVADFDPSGRLTLWTSSQSPQNVKNSMSSHFGMEPGKIRVIAPYLGGGFCGKVAVLPQHVCAAALSRKANRPVKLECSREETFIIHRGASPTIIRLKTGVKRDGTLVALQCDLINGLGGYLYFSPKPPPSLGYGLSMVYRLPNVKCVGYFVHTNLSPFFVQRGSWVASSCRAVDSQLDMIATDLGIDPVELRLRNALRSGDRWASGHQVPSSGLSECIEKVVEVTNWRKKRGKLPPYRGIGIGCYAYHTGPPAGFEGSSTMVHVHQDGTVTLITGANDNGQGSSTVLCQIAAEELGVGIEDVRITLPDTDITPFDPGSSGQRCTLTAGNATKLAAADAKRQLLELAANKLGVKAEELEVKDKRIYIKKNPEKGIPLATIAAESNSMGKWKPILGKGSFGREHCKVNYNTGEGGAQTFSFGAVVAEVQVDKETGLVRVCEVTLAHDCGLAINPMAVEGQIEGQIQMGMGLALSEEIIRDKGKIVNPNYVDYRMPRPLDMPKVRSIIVEVRDPTNPLGVKGCGEGLQGGIIPAIANAIYNAIGVRINDLPITPEKVLKALRDKGEAKC